MFFLIQSNLPIKIAYISKIKNIVKFVISIILVKSPIRKSQKVSKVYPDMLFITHQPCYNSPWTALGFAVAPE